MIDTVVPRPAARHTHRMNALAGIAHHFVPFCLRTHVVDRLKQPGRATLALSRLLLTLPLCTLWYTLVWCLLAR